MAPPEASASLIRQRISSGQINYWICIVAGRLSGSYGEIEVVGFAAAGLKAEW
jgi:hypothetical protein